MRSDLFGASHERFRDQVRPFVEKHLAPNLADWDRQRRIHRDAWLAAAEHGVLGVPVPAQYGGKHPIEMQRDYRYRAVVIQEIARIGAAAVQSGFSTNDDVILSYLLDLGTEEQKRRWVPGFATGETIAAIVMTEPDAGSDLRRVSTSALRDGDAYVVNGTKTFITSGVMADLLMVMVCTDPDAGARGYSLLLIERDTPGFRTVKQLDKIGLDAQDTAELVFEDARVPVANLLGDEGGALAHLRENLALERLGIALAAQFGAEAVLDWTQTRVLERRTSGGPLANLQSIGFRLAELETDVEVSRAFVDRCIRAYSTRDLSAVDAAKAKLTATEMQWRVVDAGVQLHGGYGYLREYPVAKAFLDARVQRIYGGTNEIMKEIISRDIQRRTARRLDRLNPARPSQRTRTGPTRLRVTSARRRAATRVRRRPDCTTVP